MELLSRVGIEVPNHRRMTYIPPESVSHHPSYPDPPRKEQVPKRVNPQLLHIVTDDLVDDGCTLECCIKALEQKGVERDMIWFLGDICNDLCSYRSRGPFLDRVVKILNLIN